MFHYTDLCLRRNRAGLRPPYSRPFRCREVGKRLVFQRSKIADLAERIDRRAQQGTVTEAATARTVAITMRLYAEGHPSLRNSHPHHVEDWTDEPHTVLAYCTNATLAVGAWEHYAPQYPQRNLIATWGRWITRGSKRDQA